ncbi:hypothetical protein HK102_010658 [Quaeritorhiza haematococci]|nr:hypothetical protein HK102_010658 [Quaeritorhiza haematococci]
MTLDHNQNSQYHQLTPVAQQNPGMLYMRPGVAIRVLKNLVEPFNPVSSVTFQIVPELMQLKTNSVTTKAVPGGPPVYHIRVKCWAEDDPQMRHVWPVQLRGMALNSCDVDLAVVSQCPTEAAGQLAQFVGLDVPARLMTISPGQNVLRFVWAAGKTPKSGWKFVVELVQVQLPVNA